MGENYGFDASKLQFVQFGRFYAEKNSHSNAFGKWYAQIKNLETLNTRKLAKQKKEGMSINTPSFDYYNKSDLLHLFHDGLEGFGIVHGEVSEYLAVDLDTGLGELAHKD